MDYDDFRIDYQDYIPAQQPLRESLCTLGNGYFATRGAHESSTAGGVHYPGTYLAGGYNRLESRVAGEIIESEDLVNWPNWLVLTFHVDQTGGAQKGYPAVMIPEAHFPSGPHERCPPGCNPVA